MILYKFPILFLSYKISLFSSLNPGMFLISEKYLTTRFFNSSKLLFENILSDIIFASYLLLNNSITLSLISSFFKVFKFPPIKVFKVLLLYPSSNIN